MEFQTLLVVLEMTLLMDLTCVIMLAGWAPAIKAYLATVSWNG